MRFGLWFLVVFKIDNDANKDTDMGPQAKASTFDAQQADRRRRQPQGIAEHWQHTVNQVRRSLCIVQLQRHMSAHLSDCWVDVADWVADSSSA